MCIRDRVLRIYVLYTGIYILGRAKRYAYAINLVCQPRSGRRFYSFFNIGEVSAWGVGPATTSEEGAGIFLSCEHHAFVRVTNLHGPLKRSCPIWALAWRQTSYWMYEAGDPRRSTENLRLLIYVFDAFHQRTRQLTTVTRIFTSATVVVSSESTLTWKIYMFCCSNTTWNPNQHTAVVPLSW